MSNVSRPVWQLITSPDDGRTSVVVSTPDGVLTASSSHPSFRDILAELRKPEPVANPHKWVTDSSNQWRGYWGDKSDEEQFAELQAFWAEQYATLKGLFDVGVALGTKFEAITDRVRVGAGHVFFDNEEVNNTLSDQIMAHMRAGAPFMPLVRFMERIASNPNPHSREHLYRWLEATGGKITITDDGLLIGYKGLTADGKSCTAGPGIVNGVAVNGQLDNAIGNVVEMERKDVTFAPEIGCSSGLHVGVYDYASTFGSGVCATVEVDPKDVVSVPTDCSDQKMRVCRYKVIDHTGQARYFRNELIADSDWSDDEYDEYEDDEDIEELSDDEVVVEVKASTLKELLKAFRARGRRS